MNEALILIPRRVWLNKLGSRVETEHSAPMALQQGASSSVPAYEGHTICTLTVGSKLSHTELPGECRDKAEVEDCGRAADFKSHEPADLSESPQSHDSHEPANLSFNGVAVVTPLHGKVADVISV